MRGAESGSDISPLATPDVRRRFLSLALSSESGSERDFGERLIGGSHVDAEDWRCVGLKGHDHAVQASGLEQRFIDVVEEAVASVPRLDFFGRVVGNLDGNADAHCDGVWDEADREAGEIDDVEDGRGFGGFIEGD